MGIRAAWKALWTAETKASAAGSLIALTNVGQPVLSRRDYKAFAEEGYRKNVVAFKAINEVSRAVASIPWMLFAGSEDQSDPIDQHPLLELLKRPNPLQARSEFIEAVTGFYLIAGNSFIEAVLPERSGASPMELWPLRPDRMQVKAGETGLPDAYVYKVGGQDFQWKADVITGESLIRHLKTFNPTDDFYGLSPLEAAALGIDQHNEAGRWNVALMQNSARPSGAIVFEPKDGAQVLDPEQRADLKDQLEQQYQGSRNSGRPILLEGGLKWQQIALTPKEIDFLNGKHTSARDISIALGVPPQLLGIPGDNTFSNYQEARRALWEDTVIPLARHLRDELNVWLAPMFAEGLMLDLDLDDIPALADRRRAHREAVRADVEAGLLTINEGREELGREPVQNGDVVLVSAGKLPLGNEDDESDPPEPDDEEARAEHWLAYGHTARLKPNGATA